MKDLISRQAVRLIESDSDAYPQEWNDDYEKGFTDALNKVIALPSAQSDGYTDQLRWERDVAIQQLKELGYSLGEKPRTDGDTISRQAAIDALSTPHGILYPIRTVEALPSAQTEPQWIPCSNCERRCDKWEHSKISQE